MVIFQDKGRDIQESNYIATSYIKSDEHRRRITESIGGMSDLEA